MTNFRSGTSTVSMREIKKGDEERNILGMMLSTEGNIAGIYDHSQVVAKHVSVTKHVSGEGWTIKLTKGDSSVDSFQKRS